MEKMCRKYLMTLARQYAQRKRLALTTVARRFHGNDAFFDDFAVGKRSVTLRKLEEMLVAFKREWPDDLPWLDADVRIKSQTRANESGKRPAA